MVYEWEIKMSVVPCAPPKGPYVILQAARLRATLYTRVNWYCCVAEGSGSDPGGFARRAWGSGEAGGLAGGGLAPGGWWVAEGEREVRVYTLISLEWRTARWTFLEPLNGGQKKS